MSMLQGSLEQSYFRHRMLPVTANNVTELPCLYTPYAVMVVVNNLLLDRSQVNISSGNKIGFARPLVKEDRVVVFDLPQVQITPGLSKVVEAYSTYNNNRYISAATTLSVVEAYGSIVCQGTADFTVTLPASNLMTDGARITFILDSDYTITLQGQAGDLRGLGTTTDKFVLFERGCHVELLATNAGWIVVDTNHYSNLNYRAIVGAVEIYPSRELAAVGTIFGDGQVVSRATYPDLWKLVEQGKVPVVAEATWLADPTKRTAYTVGNGSTTFRVPDYNGKQAGSIAAFMRGDGGVSPTTTGGIQGDAIRNITGTIVGYADTSTKARSFGTGTGALQTTTAGTDAVSPMGQPGTVNGGAMTFDASLVVPTASENRPYNFSVVVAIRAFGYVTNVGMADAAQLATDLANIAAQVGLGATPVVYQNSVGTAPDQIPTNQDLGKLAYLDEVGVLTPQQNQPTAKRAIWFEFVSNTQVKLLMRGDDGVVRSTPFTLS